MARLSGVAGLVSSADWLLYSAIRKEALLTSPVEHPLQWKMQRTQHATRRPRT
ncbi:MAG: hypothetical protein ABI606_05650 [Rhodoferax sp.]